MRNFHQHHIERLILENFQSIREQTTIDFKPITFLCGPNSAGKSSIRDALEYIDAALNSSKTDFENRTRRWIHRSETSASRQNLLLISAKFNLAGIASNSLHNEMADESYFRLPSEIHETTHDNLITSIQENEHSIEISLSIAATGEIKGLAVATGEKRILEFENDADSSGYMNLRILEDANGHALAEICRRHGTSYTGDASTTCWIELHPLRFTVTPSVDPLAIELTAIGNFILGIVQKGRFAPKTVAADRGTINSCNLFSLYHDQIYNDELNKSSRRNEPLFHLHGVDPDIFGTPEEITKHFLRQIPDFLDSLLYSKFYSETKQHFRSEIKKISDPESGPITNEMTAQSASQEPLHEFVNRSLSDHLFLENGYQIAYEIIDLKSSPQDGTRDKSDYLCRNAVVTCYLRDNSGRAHVFEDVGTGVSCVLPVLVTLHGHGTAFVEQPELHLHPALQAALGDVLAESRVWHGTKILETHSEYIILRCLKRIRDTTSKRISPNAPLAIKPEDIGIYYFWPQAEGHTKVKRIRVSSNGEFLDRWPRGFFEERGKELFDE